MKSIDCSLYLATDVDICGGRDMCELVEIAIANGVTMLQLREKTRSASYMYEIGIKLRQITKQYKVPLIINDRVDLALALGADGVHVGRSDLPLAATRKIIGDKMILGYSVSRLEHLRHAIEEKVDMIGIGPIFPTTTKLDADNSIGLSGVQSLTSQAPFPCVAIGGITAENCGSVINAGASGVCVISGILGKEDIAAVTKQYLSEINKNR